MALPTSPYTYQMLIAGRWVEARDGKRYTWNSPAHDVPVGDYPEAGASDVDAAVAAARKAFVEKNRTRRR